MSARATLWSLDFALFAATASAFVGLAHYYQRRPIRRASTRRHVSFLEDNDAAAVSLPLIEEVVKSSRAKGNRPILGLLFAAGWCPDCFEVVPAVGRIAKENSSLVDFVYVSSDISEAEMLKFKPSSLHHIPYDDVEQRTALKRQFHTCAAKEMTYLDITDRRHGTPTLILMETATGRVLTENGVDDVMKSGSSSSPSQALGVWKAMLISD